MIINKNTFLFLLCSFFPLANAQAFTSTVVVTQEQIQQRVNQAFPIDFGNSDLSIKFYHPKVKLENHRNRIILTTHARIDSQGKELEHTTISFGGKPYYYAKTGEFRLRDLWLESFKANSLTPAEEIQLTMLVNLALINVMADIPIYKLDENNLRERIAKRRLKSAKVENGELVMEFSLD